MSNLDAMRTLADDLYREERAQEARGTLRRPKTPGRARKPRIGTFLSRLRARATLAVLSIAHNGPRIKEAGRKAKGSVMNYAGVGCIAYGLYLVTPTLGWIAAGLGLLTLSWSAEMDYAREATQESPEPARRR